MKSNQRITPQTEQPNSKLTAEELEKLYQDHQEIREVNPLAENRIIKNHKPFSDELLTSYHSKKSSNSDISKEYLTREEIEAKELLKIEVRQNPQDTSRIIAKLNKFYLTGAKIHNNNISAREIHGRAHQEQQDAFFIGEINKNLNQLDFYQNSNQQLYQNHKECKNGSTLTSFIFKPNQQNWQNSSITTNNIGDSRISLNIENDEGEFVSIALTKDQDLSDAKIRQKIEADENLVVHKVYKEGKELKITLPQDTKPDEKYPTKLAIFAKKNPNPNDKTNVWMTQVGSFGDNGNKKFGYNNSEINITGYPYFNPQINQFSLEQLTALIGEKNAKFSLDKIKNINIIGACDGIYDALENDYQLNIDEGNISLEEVNNSKNKTLLSDVEKTYKSKIQSISRRITSLYSETNRADYIAISAFNDNRHRSDDNITICHVKIINNKNLVQNSPIIASIADGHGNSEITYNKQDGNHALIEKNQLEEADGSFVSSSIIAKQMLLAKAKPIFEPSRYVSQYLEKYLAEFLSGQEIYEKPRTTIIANETRKAESPKAEILGIGNN
jgi:hypothetical protein